MKKLTQKLKINKQTIAALDNSQMRSVKGGFTWSLSLGSVCHSEKNPTDCGTTSNSCVCSCL